MNVQTNNFQHTSPLPTGEGLGEGLKVCVKCATFNHAPYVTETMDGFSIQQTDFPYVCVIIDDASTDGNQAVIEHYLFENFEKAEENITTDYRQLVAHHKENKNCYFVLYLLKENHYSQGRMPLKYAEPWMEESEYVAMCEGDDYWTDEHKLQKQADALDANHKAMMVYTGFRNVDAEGKPIGRLRVDKFPSRSHSGDNLPTLLRYGNYVLTVTTMYRSEVWQGQAYLNCPHKMDFGLTLAAALMGDFVFLPEQTACYRQHQGSMIMQNRKSTQTLKQGLDRVQDIYRYYARLILHGQCKSLSLSDRLRLRLLMLKRARRKKDWKLLKYVLLTF